MYLTSLSRALCAATVLAASAITSAQANAEAPTSSFVKLSVQENGTSTANTTTLGCHPPRGAHPKAEQACASLTAAKGDFGSLKSQSAQCPLVYKPVTATARGTWRGEPLDYTKEFDNACVAMSQTDGVFDF